MQRRKGPEEAGQRDKEGQKPRKREWKAGRAMVPGGCWDFLCVCPWEHQVRSSWVFVWIK